MRFKILIVLFVFLISSSLWAGSWSNSGTTDIGCQTVSIPAGATNVTAQLTMTGGDWDLYLRGAACPTTTTYDCRPYLSGTATETCGPYTLNACQLYVWAKVYTSGGTWTLSVTWTDPTSYCSAGANTCDEKITNVNVGSGLINNSSGCGLNSGGVTGYSDYTSQTATMVIGTGYSISITNGSPCYTGDQCAVWIDWNQDKDFCDANESITLTGGPCSFSGTITPPAGALTGNTRMRVRLTYTGAYYPCGNTTYGEVEDYTINICTAPSISSQPSNATICAGGSANFSVTATGTTPSYQWKYWNGSSYVNVANGTPAGSTYTNPTTATVTVGGITSASTYTYNCYVSNACGNVTSSIAKLTVNSNPTVSISPSAASICNGSSTTLSASGASTYAWSPSTGLNSTTGASVTASPTSTTNYTVTGTGANGCTATATSSVTVNSLPSLTITPSSASYCIGGSTSLTASGASTYAWAPSTALNSTTGAAVIANPTTTITYTVTGTDSKGCVNTKTVTVTVNPLPSLTVTSTSSTICNGSNTTLTATGASTYAWAPSTGLNNTTNASVTASPTTTTTYTVTGTSAAGCTSTKTVTVTVNPLPILTTSVSPSSTICSGNSTTLTVSGANTYAWSPSSGLNSTTGSSVTASPTATTTYTVTGTDGNGCTNTKTVAITVNALPSLTVSPTAVSICKGNSTNITASGASSYAWSPSSGLNSTTGSSVTASPTATTTYTVTGTSSNGCTNTGTSAVTVNGIPSVTVSPSPTTICYGASATLTASGATTYAWSPSTALNVTTGATVIASPTGNLTYTVTGTASGCSGTQTVLVNVFYLNGGTAVATGGTDACSNSQVSLSLLSTKTVTVGTNSTLASERYPFNGFYDYSWSDVIYMQSELGAAGTISQLSFFVNNSPSNYTMNNQKIYIRSSSATGFSDGSYPGTSGFTQVFSGSITYNGSGWKTITLNTPFSYDGLNNLEILYENRNGAWANGFPLFDYTSGQSTNRVKRDFQDGSFPSSCSSCLNLANVLNTQFTIDRTLGTFVKWQSSTDNTNYSDLTGGNTQNFTTNVFTSTYFRAQVSSSICSPAYSVPALYNTKNIYYVNDNSTSGDIFTTAVGSSVNDGKSPSRPKASINAVFATYVIGPCDSIFVDKGTYSEETDIFSSDGGDSHGYAVVIGAGVNNTVLNAPANSHNFYLGTNYMKIQDVAMNNTNASHYNIEMYEAAHNIISGTKLSQTAEANIVVFGDAINANGNQILNNTITNSSSPISSTEIYNGIFVEGNCDSLIAQGNTITMSNSNSIDAILITTFRSGPTNYYPSAGNIAQNTISAYSYGVSLWGYDYPIATYTISANNITMQSNATADGAPVWLGGVGASSAAQSIIYGNRLIGGKNGIYFAFTANYTKSYNNYISGNDYGIKVATTSSNNNELYFNSFYNTTNNLFYDTTSYSSWNVKNNILYNTSSSSSNACINLGSSSTFTACDYNLFYNPNGASTGRINTINYSTLTAWQAVNHASGTPHGDENSKTGNPQYVNASSNNLDIPGTSPASVAGTSISGITKDIYSNTRTVPPSIGADDVAPIPTITIAPSLTICSGTTVTLTANSGSANSSTYIWSPGSATTSAITVSPSTTTSYSVQVTYLGGFSTTASKTITVNQSPSADAGSNQTINIGESVTLGCNPSAFGGLPPYQYSWSPASSLITSTSANPIATPTTTTEYTLTVTDANGCTRISTGGINGNGSGLKIAVYIPSYNILQKKLDGGYYLLQNGKLFFTIDGEYNQGNLNYRVFDKTRQIVLSGFGPISPQSRNVGDNRYALTVFSSIPNGYYDLEVENEKHEKLYLRFKK